jgi:hypothetical protein
MKSWKKSHIAALLRSNFEGEDYTRLFAAFLDVYVVIDEKDCGKTRLMNKFLAVRLCSMLRIKAVMTDARLGRVVRASEDFLYGDIFPELGWAPRNCPYYTAGLKEKLKLKTYVEKLGPEEKLALCVK